ncbi:MAG: DUF2499 domain-containing protein [Wenzhouxiangella sp.]|jgi:hypothetical protein|nr:DUF2499 domain-containing protein [Wenzhouxiangella sp.]
MLLSLPTWIIHILTVSEWLVALVLFERYGRAIGSSHLRLFALCMVPHLFAGASILLFHVGGDQWDAVLGAARALTFVGSLMLLGATLSMLPIRHSNKVWWLVPIVLAGGLAYSATHSEGAAALLPLTNSMYLVFLVALLFVRRADPRLFSRLTVAGFWFLLVFVIVTLFNQHVAVNVWGLPSLSHADTLHGASEAVLSLSNLMIALGVHLQLRRQGANQSSPVPGPATART